jgi:hypothetical protein
MTTAPGIPLIASSGLSALLLVIVGVGEDTVDCETLALPEALDAARPAADNNGIGSFNLGIPASTASIPRPSLTKPIPAPWLSASPRPITQATMRPAIVLLLSSTWFHRSRFSRPYTTFRYVTKRMFSGGNGLPRMVSGKAPRPQDLQLRHEVGQRRLSPHQWSARRRRLSRGSSRMPSKTPPRLNSGSMTTSSVRL